MRDAIPGITSPGFVGNISVVFIRAKVEVYITRGNIIEDIISPDCYLGTEFHGSQGPAIFEHAVSKELCRGEFNCGQVTATTERVFVNIQHVRECIAGNVL